jgi:amino acid adenylation domain-containing protein
VHTSRGERRTLALPPALAEHLRALGRREGATMFMVLLAAFKLWLSRQTGEQDITAGSPVSGRERPEVQRVIGFFVNTLALRTDLSGSPTFVELLARVRETALGAFAHADVPFEKLVEELRPERGLTHTPLFQVMFNLLNFDEARLDMPGVRAEILSAAEADSKFDLTLYARETSAGVMLEALYNADIFTPSRADEMLAQLAGLLAQIAERPDRTIESYTLVTPQAREVLPRPTEKIETKPFESIVARFTGHAVRTPQSAAVSDKDGAWSYAELDARSSQLANCLRARGVRTGDVVAVYAHRSAPLVAALVGVWKAGAAFVILDAAYPSARLAECVRAARPRAWLQVEAAGAPPRALEEVLTESDLLCRLELSRTSARDLNDDDRHDLLADCSPGAPDVQTEPDAPAYVAFTSGSTGTPKGILGTHRPLAHFLGWHASAFGLSRGERFSLLSGLSHDPLLRDLFAPLWTGATLCIPDAEDIWAPGRLALWMEREGVTAAHLTPAMLQLLASGATTDAPRLTSLRRAFFGGDVLTRRDVAKLRRMCARDVTCVSFYGATETPQAMGFNVVETEDERFAEDDRAGVPVGRGIEGVQLLVLNGAKQPAGVGEAGEIYVRTPYLALGYLNDDALTRERFVTNPFTGDAGDRLYKTGDLGRYMTDGRVEFLGRADAQLKIRGFRVEPGEVEAALASHGSVSESVIVAHADEAGEKSLVAYVVTRDGRALTDDELRDFLASRVPDYTMPSAFVTLDSLPLTPNGKVDRKQLPAPERTTAAREFVAPRDANEEMLAGLWADVLRRERVGAEDNFFALGGHSLLAAQMVSRVRELFRVELPLRAVFEAPTVARLAARIRELRRTAEGLDTSPIEPAPRDSELPLSYAQQRLWFLDQLEPDSPFYNVPAAVRMEGALNVAALEQALNEVVRRHESLRTSFAEVEGRPAQVVTDGLTLSLPAVELSHLSEGERERETRRLAAEEARRPFDLTRAPLVRASLLRLKETEHVVLLTMHHVISDGWSMGVFVREMSALYVAFTEGQPSPLAPLKIQYADFAAWQRRPEQQRALEKQLAYWRRQLEGVPALIELPTDRPRPAVQTYEGARLHVALDAPLAERLRELSRREGATLFMTLLAAFQTLLYRYARQTDIVVGTPCAGRTRLETEKLIGCFVNTLVLRARMSDTQTFRELLARTREDVLAAYAHQDVPFEKLVEELRPARNLGHTPLFQVMFTLQNTPREAGELHGIKASVLEVDTATAKFDLELILTETEDGLAGVFEYNSHLFDAATIARLGEHFRTLVAGAVARPDTSVSELPLLTDDERAQLLVGWNGTRAEFPLGLCMHELFERQAGRTPHASAVLFEGGSLTYAELNRRANVAARRLVAAGVGPETVVALGARRGVAFVTSVLAVFKAGGAYLPLDPHQPPVRLRRVLRQSGSPLIVASSEFADAMRLSLESRADEETSDDIRPSLFVMEDLLSDDAATEAETHNLARRSAPQNLAYVIYTSGSTGLPKGATVEQRGMVNHLFVKVQDLALAASDVVAQTASQYFDISVWQMLAPLVVGGAVRVYDDETARDATRLLEEVARDRVTVVETVPSLLRAAVEGMSAAGGGPELPSLRWMIVTGEALAPELCRQWLAAYPQVPMLNAYGPTECSDDVTHHVVASPPAAVVALMPIGRAVQNMRLYVLGRRLELLPGGAVGEVCVAGTGVGRGYVNDPRRTAEVFVPDPFSTEPGGRLYQTGDLGRFLPDGSIEFLGRVDQQVKVRGFRIELGEIEAALAEHEAVRECVVVAREEAGGEKRLVAYVGARPDESPASVEELRRHLQQRVPGYMIPAAFVTLDSLPLTPNGKVDRERLPAPDASRDAGDTEYVAPRSETEAALAEVWSEVLGVERVGVNDNFFALGGHSLLAARVAARVRARFEVELPLRNLFETPDVASIARFVEEKREAKQPARVAPKIQARRRGGKNLQELLSKVSQLSDGEAGRLLAEKRPASVERSNV